MSNYQSAIEALRQGRLEDALAAMETAQDERPDATETWLHTCAVHMARNEPGSAGWAARKGLEISPDSPVAKHLSRSLGLEGFDAPLAGEVRELFDAYAPEFDRHLVDGLGYVGHERIAELLTQRVTSPLDVIWDLGCGTGLCGPNLQPLSSRLIGVDLSPEMAKRAGDSGYYHQAFADDLVHALYCEAAETVDGVVSTDVLSYIGDLSAVHAEVNRVLRPGGWFAYTVESCEDAAWELADTRRCRYRQDHLRAHSASSGLLWKVGEQAVLRRQGAEPVEQHVVLLQKRVDE